MPYDKANPAHRQRVTERLARSRSRVPRRAVDTFIAVWNRVHGATNDDGKAYAAAAGVVNRRFPSDLDEETHAALPTMAALAPVARALAVALGQRTLRELELTLQNCDCGKDHARTLRALQLAIQYASRAAGNLPPDVKQRRHAASGLLIPMAAGYHARSTTFSEPKNLRVKNVRYVWEVFAKHIYHNADKVFIAVREMLQNSRDAKAKNIQIQWIPEDPTNESSDGTIVFRDDGRGMDADKVENAFLAIGESGEEKRSGDDDQLGGFGAAKAAILTASRDGWSWEVRTRNVIARSAPGGSYQIGSTDEGYVSGTQITLFTVRGGDVSTPLGWGSPDQRIRQLISTCDLRGLRVEVDGQRVPTYFEGRRGRHGEIEQSFEHDLDWGAFRPAIASYARPSKTGGAIIVRVKGLAQFALAAPYGAHFERDWVLDFEIPKGVTPQTPEYPFNAGRDRFEPGSPAFYAFKRLSNTLEVQAATGTRDLGEYEELAPDASDPREQKAQAQFNTLLDDVLGSDGFQGVLAEIVESNDEMHNAVTEALVSGGERAPDESQSDRPGSRRAAPPATSDAAVVATLVESLLLGDLSEQATRIEAFVTTALPNSDLGYFNASLGRLSRSNGYAEDLAVVTRVLQEAVTASAPTLSALTVGAAVARILRSLERGIHSAEAEQVKVLKRKGEINPFGNAACVFTHRERFGVEAGRAFRKKARKYMRHLVAWDFCVRAVLTAANASAANSWYRIDRLGVGFVLDPDVLGLTRKDGHFVMVNPLALDAIVETYRDRPIVVAVWLHSVVCHEIAHAMQIQGHGSSAHNTDWSIVRENLAAETLFLLPVIEDAVAKTLKLKRRRQRRPVTAEQTDARVVRLETALAEAQTQIDEYRASATERTRLLSRYSDVAHRLQHLVGLYEFRGWLQKNPSVMSPYGFSVDSVLDAFDGPGSGERMMAMIEEMERAEQAPRAAAMRRAGLPYLETARSAMNDLRGLGGRSLDEDDRVEHAACSGCGGACGGDHDDEEDAALRAVPNLMPPIARINPPS